jgi:hypothetical protein
MSNATMQRNTLTFTAYARHRGVAVSSISRAVARGDIPVVVVDGERRIDPLAADAARAARRLGSIGTGGSAQTRAADAALRSARYGAGFDVGQHRLLKVLTADAPRLLVAGMREAGVADELALARAAASLAELVAYLACLVHDDFNRDGIRDYRLVLPETTPPTLGPEGLAEFLRLAPEDAEGWWSDDWGFQLHAAFRPAKL